MMYHRHSLVSRWKPTTLGPNCWTAFTAKCDDGQWNTSTPLRCWLGVSIATTPYPEDLRVQMTSVSLFFKYAQVHVGLGHPPQFRLQSPVTTITYIIGAEPNRHCPPCRLPSNLTHPRPTNSFFTPSPAALSARSRFPFRRSRPRSIPVGLPSPFSYPFPYPFSPLFYSVPFTSE